LSWLTSVTIKMGPVAFVNLKVGKLRRKSLSFSRYERSFAALLIGYIPAVLSHARARKLRTAKAAGPSVFMRSWEAAPIIASKDCTSAIVRAIAESQPVDIKKNGINATSARAALRARA